MKKLFAFTFLAAGIATQAFAAGLFGLIEIKADRIDSIPKWVDVLQRIREEDLFEHCNLGDSECLNKREDWYRMVQGLQGASMEEQMNQVNDWINRYPYITDDDLWGRSDYWETPGQFLDRSGDCEDYAIAKYYTLKRLGWSDNELRLLIVQDTVREIPHAVLEADLGDDKYILDNLATRPLLDRYVKQYTPYYAVNARSRWVFIKPMQ